jgi:hypothetical protein
VKTDDSSLDEQQYLAVHAAAVGLLNRAGAKGTFPTPSDELLRAAELKMAPVSVFDEGAMQRYLQAAGQNVGRLLRRAMEKVLGILDVHAKTVHVDTTVSGEKQRFITLHETGHGVIPHQKGLYRWVQDCNASIAPEVAALFEREANTFASIVLFQDDGFANMARDSEFSIKVPMRLARKFGGSVYAGIREYVRRSDKVCAVVVLDPFEVRQDIGLVAAVRRVGLSPAFTMQFGSLALPQELTAFDDLMRFVPTAGRRIAGPGSLVLTDLNGVMQEFIGEGFATPYNAFVLIHSVKMLQRAVVLPATSVRLA